MPQVELKVEPLQSDEIDDFYDVMWSAFGPPDAEMVFPLVYPNGLTPDLLERLRKRLLNATNNDVGSLCFTAKDARTGKMVGISQWEYHMEPPQSLEEIKAQSDKAREQKASLPPVEGTNHALDDAFFEAIVDELPKAAGGKPYLELRLLGTRPEYHRCGAGSLLVRNGLKKADELGLPTLLMGGKYGRPLYERLGFEIIRPFPFDCRDYGGAWEAHHWTMRRPANASPT